MWLSDMDRAFGGSGFLPASLVQAPGKDNAARAPAPYSAGSSTTAGAAATAAKRASSAFWLGSANA
jgi:hypothetical protein